MEEEMEGMAGLVDSLLVICGARGGRKEVVMEVVTARGNR
jgi:hypothetical protein